MAVLWIFETILAFDNKETALISVLRGGDLEGARTLIEAGASLLEADGSGVTALDLIFQNEWTALKELAQQRLPAKIFKGVEAKYHATKLNHLGALEIKLLPPKINWPDFDSKDIPSKPMAGQNNKFFSNLNGPYSLIADKEGTEARRVFAVTQDQTISADVLTSVTVREPKRPATEETLFDSLNEIRDNAPRDLEFDPRTSLKASDDESAADQIDKVTQQIAQLAEVN